MSLERKKHSPGFRRGTGTSPSRSWTAVVLFLVRMSSRAPRSQVVVRRLGGLTCTTNLQLHQGSILEAAKAVACPFMHTYVADQIAVPQRVRSYRKVAAFYIAC